MAKANPFFDFDPGKMAEFAKLPDYSKLFGDMKMPGLDMEPWMAIGRRNMEAFAAANQVAVQCAQSLAQRQGELLRQTLDEARRVTKELSAVGSPEEKAAQQAEFAKEAFTLAATNMRELADMVAKSNNEAFEVISKRVTAGLDELKALIAKKPAKE